MVKGPRRRPSLGDETAGELTLEEFEPLVPPEEDEDADDDSVIYGLEEGSPSGMTIDATTGLLTWDMSEVSPGEHSIRIKVHDGHGGNSFQRFALTITGTAGSQDGEASEDMEETEEGEEIEAGETYEEEYEDVEDYAGEEAYEDVEEYEAVDQTDENEASEEVQEYEETDEW